MRNFIDIVMESANAAEVEIQQIIADARREHIELEADVDLPFHNLNLIGLYRNGGNKGDGAKVMDRLCALADKYELEMRLDAEGGSEGLFDYYGRWGFELEQHVIDEMNEEPNYGGPWIMYRLAKF